MNRPDPTTTTTKPRGEVGNGDGGRAEKASSCDDLLEQILDRDNLNAAWKRVKQNGGATGVDRMEISDFRDFLAEHWDTILGKLRDGSYCPSPVRRAEIPKPDGTSGSPLGHDSKARFKDHLDRVREYEQRSFAMKIDDPRAPELPPESTLKHGGAADPGGEGIDITLEELCEEWRLMADLYALSIQMDRARFGSITFLAAGERIRLKGDYEYNGRLIHRFDDARQLNASGSKGCSHEWWHKFNEKKENEQLRAHAHMKMNEVGYFLRRLHEGEDCREANGKSILENSMITVSTESGDGRHNDVKRELSGVFHAVTGAGGRFKTGKVVDTSAEGIDIYNTMLGAMEVDEKLGPGDREHRNYDAMMA
ncbi:MAG: DUF1552 domain-containing protein [Verrucomicrobiales bacterium]